MANSTAVTHDLGTLAGTDFTSASLTKAKNAHFDLIGAAGDAAMSGAGCKSVLTQIAANLDSADPALVLVTSILGTLS